MRRLAALLLVAAGCYSPSAAPGAWLCDATNGNACPDGQHCTCNQCVARDDQAACGFDIAIETPMPSGNPPTPCMRAGAEHVVREHQGFTVTVRALTASGAAATGFAGSVALSSSWGDVTPATLTLDGGTATATVALDREVTPPQFARLSAIYGAVEKDSDVRLCVDAPAFVRDAAPIVTPPLVLPPDGDGTQRPFGWANAVVNEPAVVGVAGGWRMYFAGAWADLATHAGGSGIGLATSTDGLHFMPSGTPLFPSDDSWPYVAAPTVVADPSGATLLAFVRHQQADLLAPTEVVLARSPDGLAGFALQDAPLLEPADCPFCMGSLDFPSLLAESDGSWSLFFNGSDATATGIGRATGLDLAGHLAPEPGPVLSGELGGERYLAVPRVILDGSVYKMFYSYVEGSFTDLCSLDVPDGTGGIGYATSSDGNYWIRSPSNPVVANPVEKSGWELPGKLLVVGSVVPADGSDPASGLVLYYSSFYPLPLGHFDCAPSGVGRAVARGN